MSSRLNDFVIKVANVTVEDSRAMDGARKNDTKMAPLERLAAK
ncbi:MAG TPA: hypothetical protein VGH91_11715 [Gammaproteobacteria bacterium]|jgi:hypothetical protein